MKTVKNSICMLLLIAILGVGCKLDNFNQDLEVKSKNELDSLYKETIEIDKKIDSIEIKKNQLKIIPIKSDLDDVEIAENYLESKRYFKETNTYSIDFCYPYLNENFNPKFENFNNYIKNELLKLPKIEKDILEGQKLLCDSLDIKSTIEHRITEYKIFFQNEEHLSVLFYLENHYTKTKAAYYTFKTINFDMIKGKLLSFEDYFSRGSIEEVKDIVNVEITSAINNGDMLYECFPVSLEDFRVTKDDFVVNDDSIIFYFNDCIMCPAFVGTYEIKIPLERFKPVLKRYWKDKL